MDSVKVEGLGAAVEPVDVSAAAGAVPEPLGAGDGDELPQAAEAKDQHTNRTFRKECVPLMKPFMAVLQSARFAQDRQAERKSTRAAPKSGSELGFVGSPNGIRTRAATLRGWCPRPLDDGAVQVAPAIYQPQLRAPTANRAVVSRGKTTMAGPLGPAIVRAGEQGIEP